VLVLLLAAAAFLFRTGWQTWARSRAVAETRREAEEELARWQVRREELAVDVDWLSTARGQEELIREKFSVAKEGEKVISVIEPPAEAEPGPPSAPWWQVWWGKILVRLRP
jgi:cell division protein FtsB